MSSTVSGLGAFLYSYVTPDGRTFEEYELLHTFNGRKKQTISIDYERKWSFNKMNIIITSCVTEF